MAVLNSRLTVSLLIIAIFCISISCGLAADTTITAGSPSNEASLPEDLNTLLSAGVSYKQNGNFDQAEPYLRKGLRLVGEKFGTTSKEYMTVTNLLAGNCRYQGKLAESERLYKEALELARAKGASDEQIATILDNMSMVQEEAGHLREAAATDEEALPLYKKSVGEKNVDYAMALAHYGHLLTRIGRVPEGIKAQEQAIETFKSLSGFDPKVLANTYDNLGSTLTNQGKYDDAIKYRKQALEIYEQLRTGDRDWVIGMDNLANTLTLKGDYPEAVKVYDKLLAVVDSTQGPNSMRSIETRRLQAEVGSHIPGWKQEPPKAGTDLTLPKNERVLKAIARVDGAFPNVNPTQLSELVGQTVVKGRIPGFWYSPETPNTTFRMVTAQVPPDRDVPRLITLTLNGDTELTKTQVIAQFGQPSSAKEVAVGKVTNEALKYDRSWGSLNVGANKADGKIRSVLFLYK
jgi:tetratricopeptide (TPR) repeat protein